MSRRQRHEGVVSSWLRHPPRAAEEVSHGLLLPTVLSALFALLGMTTARADPPLESSVGCLDLVYLPALHPFSCSAFPFLAIQFLSMTVSVDPTLTVQPLPQSTFTPHLPYRPPTRAGPDFRQRVHVRGRSIQPSCAMFSDARRLSSRLHGHKRGLGPVWRRLAHGQGQSVHPLCLRRKQR